MDCTHKLPCGWVLPEMRGTMTEAYSVREEQTWVSDDPKEVQAKLHEMIDKLYTVRREYYNISVWAGHTASTNEYYVRISGMYK